MANPWQAFFSSRKPPPAARAAGAGPARRWPRWALALLGVLPFHLMLVQHLLTGTEATGFLLYDDPYYMANAREIFERGNGFAYPNPYDFTAGAPVIYFHWLLWLLGAGVHFLQVDPGALFALVGVLASIVCSALTLRLVELVLPDPRGRPGWFLLTMWGGGILCLTAAALNVAGGQPLLADLFRLDAGEGWWFPNWGRNLFVPPEAVYHCLVAGAWIAVVQRRGWLALGLVGALAATHPFSGLHHGLIMGAWLGGVAWRDRTPAAWGRVVVIGAILAAFGLYYFWFLNSYPSHRRLVAVWSTAHQVTLPNILLAIGPLLLVAGWRLQQRRWRLTEMDAFWLTALAVTFLLMKHDWFIAPHQPAHFSRGYLWLPVWLLALPQLQAWGGRLQTIGARWLTMTAGGLVGLFMVADNAAFIVRDLDQGERDRIHLTGNQREMLAWIDRAKLDGVLLSSDTRLSYLSATYTGVRPYYGHLNNTPYIHWLWREVAAWHRRGEVGTWFHAMDYILIDRTDPPAAFDWSGWTELHRNQDYLLLGRTPRPRSRPTTTIREGGGSRPAITRLVTRGRGTLSFPACRRSISIIRR